MKNSIKILIGLALVAITSQAQALLITPSTISLVPSVACTADPLCDTSATSTNDINNYIVSTYGVTELYKSNVVNDTSGLGLDEKAYADSYDTLFKDLLTGTPTEIEQGKLSGADITWDINGGDTFACPTCLLLVKDGNTDPNWYLFDLGNWNGEETIEIRDFWLGTGSISHVSIYSNNVPEPGMVGLLAIGLIGVVVARRRMKL